VDVSAEGRWLEAGFAAGEGFGLVAAHRKAADEVFSDPLLSGF
jgi:hypothetical protein